MEKVSWMDKKTNEEILRTAQEHKKKLDTIQKLKHECVGPCVKVV